MTDAQAGSSLSDNLQFVLRHYLPLRNYDDQLRLLVDHSRRHGIDEVLLFPHGVGVDDSSSGYWRDDELAADAERLRRAKEALHAAGIRFGINVWHTIGHGHRNRSWSPEFPFQPLVSDAGDEDPANACPLCPKWRKYYFRALACVAAVEPDSLWIDDDFRWNHHSARFNCFCPLHLKAYEDRFGIRIGRNELIKNVLRPGPPHPAREQWYELLQSQLVELAAEIEGTVHAISPETQLGLMSSLPDTMAMEGRRWAPLLRALAGEGRPLLYRPYYPCYSEIAPREMPHSLAVLRQIFAELPDEVEAFAELDNCYPTEFNQSPGHIALRMLLAAVCGIRGFHLSLYGFQGNADTFNGSDEYGRMLKRFRDAWGQVAPNFVGRPKALGVHLPTHRRRVLDQELNHGESLTELALDSLSWAAPLQLAGIPITFESSWASAVTADALVGHTDEELRGVLSGCAVLDASAVEWLHARGWGAWLGTCEVSGPVTSNEVLAEEVMLETDPQFGSTFEHRPLGTVLIEPRWTLREGAREITRLRGCQRKDVGPGAFEFFNLHGGRIEAVPLHPPSLAKNPFLTRYRLDGLKARLLCAAEASGQPFFVVENPPNALPLLLDYSGRKVIAVLNLRSESCARLCIRGVHLPRFERAIMFHDGRVQGISFREEAVSGGIVRIRLEEIVPMLGCILFFE